MKNDLDDRIRTLVADAVAATPDALAYDVLAQELEPAWDRPRARRGRRTVLVAAGVLGVAVVVAVSLLLRAGGSGSSPTVTPAETSATPYEVDVEALPTLRLNGDVFEAPAGPIRISFVSRGGSHTLAIRSLDVNGTELPPTELARSSGEVESTVIDLAPGEYLIYCTVPGHQAAGERATLSVR